MSLRLHFKWDARDFRISGTTIQEHLISRDESMNSFYRDIIVDTRHVNTELSIFEFEKKY